MSILKVEKFGDLVGVVLPQDMLDQLGVRVGDALHATAAPGEVRLVAQEAEIERQLEVGRKVMKRNHAVLRELAKG